MRRARTAATLADIRPPKGSHTTSPGSLDASICRVISASGFWFACSAPARRGCLIRSGPCTGDSRQTFVSAWTWFHFARKRSHCEALGGVTPSIEKYGLGLLAPKRSHHWAIATTASPGGQYQRWQPVRYFRVAALATPQAVLLCESGRPERRHSSRSQSLREAIAPSRVRRATLRV
jgi:hypothetical protein